MRAAALGLALSVSVGCGGASATAGEAGAGPVGASDARTASHEAARATDPGTSGDPWSGCATRAVRGSVFEITCPEARLRVMRVQVLEGRAGLETAMRIRDMDPALATFSERTVAGRTYPVAHFDRPDGWSSIANPAPRVAAACGSSGPACDALFDRIASAGLPAAATFPPSDMNVAGIPLTVPPGCELQGAERITCARAALDWRNDATAGIESYPRSLVAAGFVLAEEHPGTCRLGEMPGRSLLVVAAHDGAPVAVTLCEVEASGRSVAMCLGWDPRTMERPPAPCDQVFTSVEPGR